LIIAEAHPLEEERIEIAREDIEKYCKEVDIKICQYDWRLIFNWDECRVDEKTEASKVYLEGTPGGPGGSGPGLPQGFFGGTDPPF